MLNLYDVIFYRKEKNYYFTYSGYEYEVNNSNLNRLKSLLNLPFIIKFYGISKVQVQRTIKCLLDDAIDYKFYKINKNNSNTLEYVASFFEKKITIDAYKVPNSQVLYGRVNKSNPYLLTKFQNKSVLIEVTKDYYKKNGGEYYFLEKDLTETEKLAFDNFSTKIECDHIYNLSDLQSNKNKQKIKKR